MFSNLRSGLCRFRPALYGNSRLYWRRGPLTDISTAFQAMEKSMKEMEHEMSRAFDNFNRGSFIRIPGIFTRYGRDIPVETGDDRNFRVQLDVGGMTPEDISITLKDNKLTIIAKREEEGESGSRLAREYRYVQDVPKEVNSEAIRSSLVDGILTIEAPLPAVEAKEIPVKIESSGSSEAK